MDARYEIQTSLSHGEIAETWLAHDRLSGAQVVVKQVRRPDHGAVLQREFEALRGLAHHCLVEVLDLGFSAPTPGTERGLPFLVTRYVPGKTLADSARHQSVEHSVAVLADATADAMRKHPKAFDSLFVNMIAAGEAGGILDQILERLSNYIEKAVKLKSQVKSALM